MTQAFTFESGENPPARAIVEKGLEDFNARFVGERQYKRFEIYARNASNAVVGGAFGQSGMDWLYVDYLWVDPIHRGCGLGARLLALAQEEARARQCVGVYLYTYTFQALDFYRKQGFTVMGALDDCPVGHRRIYLSKPLLAPRA